ncbi:protein NATD1 [Papio anubis]|uniref:protein NATD1 n=1 Tax=Papio anubis TaxID=9555 RepID=UPI0012AD30DC|nr:protein NATD1 [Papio anubis]
MRILRVGVAGGAGRFAVAALRPAAAGSHRSLRHCLPTDQRRLRGTGKAHVSPAYKTEGAEKQRREGTQIRDGVQGEPLIGCAGSHGRAGRRASRKGECAAASSAAACVSRALTTHRLPPAPAPRPAARPGPRQRPGLPPAPPGSQRRSPARRWRTRHYAVRWSALEQSCPIRVEHDRRRRQFTVRLNGCHDRAVLLYEYVGKRIVDLQHTEVPDAYRGRGIAKHLAKAALDFVVEEDLKAHLTCWYIQKYVKENPLPQYLERLQP